jgi:E3 ubiquitin-protein ligase UBR7
LQPDKDYENSKNSYNHNFEGKYCLCNEGDYEELEMIQCLLCEDWYHNTHLEVNEVIFKINFLFKEYLPRKWRINL